MSGKDYTAGRSLLSEELTYIKGVGPQKAELLKSELGIKNIRDMLLDFPIRHIDKSTFQQAGHLSVEGEYVQLRGRISSIRQAGSGHKMRLVVTLVDESGQVELVWFRGIRGIQSMLAKGKEYIVFGRVNIFQGRSNIPHPEIKTVEEYDESMETGLSPVYSSTEQLSKRGLDAKGRRKIMSNIWKKIGEEDIPEHLPHYLLTKLKLTDYSTALKNIHFPPSWEMLKVARKRLIFEELFISQLHIVGQYLKRKRISKGHIFPVVGASFHTFYKKNLPFELTRAQKRVIKEIRKDMQSGKQMNRLLQGDVGSGKTIVSLMSMLIAIDNGFQACLMAPTSILAEQHFHTIQKNIKGLGLQVALLTGAVREKTKNEIFHHLREGTLHIIVGTHALIEDRVAFQNLGLAIIDEQHRFGVAQRAKLWKKGNTQPPHILVMTATPIPRTLHMTSYGALDISVIDELPPGRKPIKTIHKSERYRPEVIRFMRSQIDLGNQIYVVYPLIEESEKSDLEDLNNGYEKLIKQFSAPTYQISVVHGRMKSEKKEFEVERFKQKKTQIMVATTVIEVGVDIPNANVMIIENSPRFGLSQLHQLRGRVGRGSEQAYCILMTRSGAKAENERIKVMVETNDGFKIAEADLQIRGPGTVEGTQQSGLPKFQLANIIEHADILKAARAWAMHILDKDPQLEVPDHLPLRQYLVRYFGKGKHWGRIG